MNSETLLNEYIEVIEDSGEVTTLPDPKPGVRQFAHPISALGHIEPGVYGQEYPDGEYRLIEDLHGLIHPFFCKEWFDYLACLSAEARQEAFPVVWAARNQAVISSQRSPS